MTDIEMIRMIKDKDQRGLTLLYESFRPEFVNWITKFTGCNGEDASEYYQAAVLIMYDNIHNGRLEDLRSSLKTYLFSIGKNLIWDRNRQ
jgi:DNA-directed RNA polymerase specialized sigma24 family protein